MEQSSGSQHAVLVVFNGSEHSFSHDFFSGKITFQATWMITNLETLLFTHFHPRYIYTVGPWFYIFLQSKCPKKKENIYKQLQIICLSKKKKHLQNKQTCYVF